jgi:hypothetical protein
MSHLLLFLLLLKTSFNTVANQLKKYLQGYRCFSLGRVYLQTA